MGLDFLDIQQNIQYNMSLQTNRHDFLDIFYYISKKSWDKTSQTYSIDQFHVTTLILPKKTTFIIHIECLALAFSSNLSEKNVFLNIYYLSEHAQALPPAPELKKKNNFVFEVVLKTHHAVLEVCPNVFTDFESHSQIKSHRSKIIESIAGIYSTVRLHYRLKNKDAGFRRMSSKVVLCVQEVVIPHFIQ